jgi:hypothetical protein
MDQTGPRAGQNEALDRAAEERSAPNELMLPDPHRLDSLQAGIRPDAVESPEARVDDLIPASRADDVRVEPGAFRRATVSPHVARMTA